MWNPTAVCRLEYRGYRDISSACWLTPFTHHRRGAAHSVRWSQHHATSNQPTTTQNHHTLVQRDIRTHKVMSANLHSRNFRIGSTISFIPHIQPHHHEQTRSTKHSSRCSRSCSHLLYIQQLFQAFEAPEHGSGNAEPFGHLQRRAESRVNLMRSWYPSRLTLTRGREFTKDSRTIAMEKAKDARPWVRRFNPWATCFCAIRHSSSQTCNLAA